MCRNHRCFMQCGGSRSCGSSNLECVQGICRLKDGCGGESIDCLGYARRRPQGRPQGRPTGPEDSFEIADYGGLDKDVPPRRGSGGRRPQGQGGLGGRPQGQGGFGSRPQRPGFGSRPQGRGRFGGPRGNRGFRQIRHNTLAEYCEDGYVTQHLFINIQV